MYRHHIEKHQTGIFFEKLAIPQNTSSALSNAMLVGSIGSQIEIIGLVESNITITSGKKVTVEIYGSGSRDGTYTKVGNLVELTANTVADSIYYFGITPSVPNFVKVKVLSDDSAVTGTISVFTHSVL